MINNILQLKSKISSIFFAIDYPGGSDGTGLDAGMKATLSGIITGIIGLVAAVAFLNVVIGGVGYIMSDDANVAANHKTRVINGLFGVAAAGAIFLAIKKYIGI